jgi:hypothetical protein
MALGRVQYREDNLTAMNATPKAGARSSVDFS